MPSHLEPKTRFSVFHGVTLMELLLVVAIMAVISPILIPPVMENISIQRDEGAIQQVINCINTVRSMGLLGRKNDAKLTFTNSNQILMGLQTISLGNGYTIGGLMVGDASVSSFQAVFDITANVIVDGVPGTAGSFELHRPDGTVVVVDRRTGRTAIPLTGKSVPPLPPISPVEDPNPSSTSTTSHRRGCAFFH
ncbi:MAG: type II secretion system protein [Candidatus Ozemobacteraceae bacterium]